MNWKDLFGETLLIKDSNKVITTTSTEEYLQNKYILIYFSAHWCPPCRGFTPQLVTFYNNLKRNENKSFEIIFASSDKDQHSFDEYYSEMPWASIPFQEREIKNKLSSKFKISGIPSLIVLNTDGSLLTAKGRNCVGNDPSGADFPWVPQTLQQELGTHFIGKSGDVDASSFAGKFIGFYFSAHWCPPCRGFTPKLVKYYNHRKELGKDDFEIIFVSGDRDPNQFREYYNEMPWLALPFNDPRISKLNERFEIEGIPALIIIDPNGNVTTTNARTGVLTDPNGEKFPYYPEPVEDLSEGVESFGLDINSVPALIALMENSDDDDQNDARTILASFGETHAKSKVNTPEGPEMIFFYAFKKSPISDQIRRLAQLPTVEKSTTPKLLLLDIPDNGGFYVSDADEVTEDTVRDFIQGYKNKSLTRRQLSRAQFS